MRINTFITVVVILASFYINEKSEIFYEKELDSTDNLIVCDGREVSRKENSRLFGIIGENFGSGDGLNTFNVPDFTGLFK